MAAAYHEGLFYVLFSGSLPPFVCGQCQRECRASSAHTLHTQCKLLYTGNYLNPSYGPFPQVCCPITGFFMLLVHWGCGTFKLPPIFTHFQPF